MWRAQGFAFTPIIEVYNTLFEIMFVNHESLAITKSTDALFQSQATLY